MRTRWFPIATFIAVVSLVLSAGAVLAQEEETASNNLSVPVIWSDGATKTLPGVFGAPVFGGATASVDGVTYYLQQDPLNSWQAQTALPGDLGLGVVDASWVDWGDNLEARAWYETSVVRIETKLMKDLATPMTGFNMALISGSGTDEMWGTDGNTYDATQATVYSGVARLTIQKLLTTPALARLTWDATNGQWTGDVNAPLFNHGVWETGTGKPSSRYSAEINISGNIVYGYNWNLKTSGDGAGYYRITFSLADNAPVARNTSFATTQIVASTEETTTEETEATGGAPAGGIAGIDAAHNLTYIDIQILSSKGRQGSSQSDFNGDGVDDVAVYRPSNGTWYILDTTTASSTSIQFGSSNDIPMPGDYDGDAISDVAVYRTTTGEWFVHTSSDGTTVSGSWGSPGQNDKPASGDYDGDGTTDLAVYRGSSGQWFVHRSSDGGMTQGSWGSPAHGDVAAPGDYDGDGKSDLAVYRSTTGEWFINRSSDGGLTYAGWGSPANGDVAAPSDFDGDGKTDIAVYRGTTGEWFVSRSSDGGLTQMTWGSPAHHDVLIPGDFDGDGKSDVAVYRPTDSTWYAVLSSTGSGMVVQFGNASDDIPVLMRR
jgi:hypothetical protein